MFLDGQRGDKQINIYKNNIYKKVGTPGSCNCWTEWVTIPVFPCYLCAVPPGGTGRVTGSDRYYLKLHHTEEFVTGNHLLRPYGAAGGQVARIDFRSTTKQEKPKIPKFTGCGFYKYARRFRK